MINFGEKTEKRHMCFVCGGNFSNLQKMNEHIVEKHEEGREYIKCPSCSFCVRDLRLHFKVKHRDRKCPTSGQMRALIWKDFAPSGKGKTRKPKFRAGSIFSNKCGKDMSYKSGLECEFYEILEAIPSVLRYDVEPFSIPYLFEGQEHKYFPDLSIQFSDGHTEIWEIKPGAQTALPVNEAKWRAANNFCEARGLEFVVMTEVGLNKLRKLSKKS